MYTKDIIKGLFVKETINEQLLIVKKKGLNWQDVNNPAKSDVNVTPALALTLLTKVSDKIDLPTARLADISCGNGEIQLTALREFGVAVESMFTADVSRINIDITNTRLGFQTTNYLYTKDTEGINNMTSILESNKVDVEITNDPFKKDTGNSDQLYPILMYSAPKRIKTGGYRVCIDPPTWTSGTKQLTSNGRVNLLEFFTTDHNLQELDYSVNKDFLKIGSQFVTSVIQINIPYQKKTKITTVEGDVFYVDLTGVKALPDSTQISEELVKLFIAMQSKKGKKFYFKYCSNKHVKSSDYKDTVSDDCPYEYVNASSNHSNKFADKQNNVAKYFVHSAYMGSNFKFNYFLNSDISVMSNARVWIDDDLKNTNVDCLRSIFENELFKKTVYTYKFTQYNECAFINNIAVPPLNKIWTSEELLDWYLDGN
jgi:hypothetical protein